MQTRWLFLSVLSLGLLLGGNPAEAAQLDGLEIEQTGDRVQIILDTDSSQSVRVDRQEGSQTTLFLPKGKLPKAFQGTGLPPIQNPQAGVTAEVLETPEGLCIYLNSAKPTRNFYEIGFKRNQPKPTLEALKPVVSKPIEPEKSRVAPALKYHIKGNLPLAQQPVKPTAQPARMVSASKPVRPAVKVTQVVKAPSKPVVVKPVAAPQVAAKPVPPVPVKVAPVKPAVEEVHAPIVVREEEFTPPTQSVPAVAGTPPEAEESLAQAIDEEEAYALLQHAEEAPASTPRLSEKVAAKQPESLSWLGSYWSKAKGALTSSVSRWVFASILLLGVFLFVASFVAVWVKKRLVDRQPVAYELPPEVASKTPEVPAQEFFEPSAEPAAPEPETFDAYLNQAPQAPWESSAETGLPEPVKPGAGTQLLSEETGSLLFSPPKSYGDAIKSSLKSHASPNVSTPFKPVKPVISTEGGPKTKRNGGKSFNQYLKR